MRWESLREQLHCANLQLVTQGNLDQRELYWDLLPDAEYHRAVSGLRAALQLCLSAYRDLIPNQELAAAAIGDFVNWACALDERLENNDGTYAARRDADDDGRVLPALRFVLNGHINQMAITSSLVFLIERSDVNPKPAITRTRIYWRPLDAITGPADGHETRRSYLTLRACYEDQMEGREPPLAMGAALRFLSQEVDALGIEVSNHWAWEKANDNE